MSATTILTGQDTTHPSFQVGTAPVVRKGTEGMILNAFGFANSCVHSGKQISSKQHSITTDAAAVTLTPAEFVDGVMECGLGLLQDCTLTTPTAALLVQYLSATARAAVLPAAGATNLKTFFQFTFFNNSIFRVVTLAAGAGGGLVNPVVVRPGESITLEVALTNAGVGTEAYRMNVGHPAKIVTYAINGPALPNIGDEATVFIADRGYRIVRLSWIHLVNGAAGADFMVRTGAFGALTDLLAAAIATDAGAGTITTRVSGTGDFLGVLEATSVLTAGQIVTIQNLVAAYGTLEGGLLQIWLVPN